MAQDDSENFLISPHDTPQTQRFDASCFDNTAVPYDPFGEQFSMMVQKNQGSYGTNMSSAKDFDLFSGESTQSTPSYMNFAESPSENSWNQDGSVATIRKTARRISNGIMDRVSKFENLGEETQRPSTPPNQNDNSYYPPTPMETPQDRVSKQERPARFSDDYDESMEETLKPNRRRPNQRAQDVFQEMRQQAQRAAVPSPPRTAPLPNSKTFVQMQVPDYMNMNSFRDEFLKVGDDFTSMSAQTTPATRHITDFGTLEDKPDLSFDDNASNASSPSRRMHGHRRTESVASIASAASIASINIEETKTDTGVTTEEISQFIRGPDTTDGKWVCLFDDCGKKFGRKENIKSHVQTHLNDRQYQCPTCKKCFVRQHDLKRHAKIHTGIKPYPCECGNSFARHDALTRHRQRGMCIGAFDGIVRKVVKRGRPKKNRPDMDARMDKATRTRRKNLSISSMSSLSSCSDSSAVGSPEDYNMLDDVMDMGPIDVQLNKLTSLSSAPMPNAAARPIHHGGISASPSAASVHSYVSPEAVMDNHPATPAKSTTSHYNTPPELCQSSSPPPARLFDMDGMTANTEMMSSASMNNTLPIGINDHDDDLMLQFTQDDGLVQLERDPSMLLMSKFDEEFGMFTNNDDMFFGSA